MEKKNICPKCGSEHTEYISTSIPCSQASGYLVDLEVHPYLCRCLDCGTVFPANPDREENGS